MKPDEGGGHVFTVSQDFKADNADALSVHKGEKLVLVKAEGNDPSKWLMQSIDNPKRKGWVPILVLAPRDDLPDSLQQVVFKREAVVSELVETEEEYCRDIMQVVDQYMKPLDGAGVPRHVCDNKDKVFGNYKDIAIFHNTVLLEGIKYYAKQEPKQLGRAFLRMERDFDKHVTYCHDEPTAQDFLEENEKIRDYFDELGGRISDDKTIGEHLKLPVQRINDYQLLLKELVKYSEKLEEDTSDLNRALELMLGIPHKADDLKYITNIEGYHGDIHKLGRLLRHNWFKVKGKDGKEHERYLFLFKARILVCKVRKTTEDQRYVFGLKDIIRLPDIEVKDHKADPRTFEVGQFTLTSHQENVKEPWLEEIRQYSRNALTLAEHQADDLRLEEAAKKNNPLQGVELVLANPGNSSDEEMDKSSRRTSLSQRVQELKTSSVTESSYSMSRTVVMEMSSSSSTHFEGSSTRIETTPAFSQLEIEDLTSRCNLTSLFTKTIEGSTAEPGGSAAFECDIDAESIYWIKDNKPISDRLHDRITQMSIGSHHSLEILNVAETDAGVYTAIANTKSGKVSTCTANLVVEKRSAEAKRLSEEEKKARDASKAPVFVVKLRDTELIQNTFLRFMVKVKGDPNPTIKFYKNEEEITYKNEHIAVINDKESLGYYEMVIPSVQSSDVGVYKCVATNQHGSASCDGKVTVVDEKKVFEGMESPKTPKEDASFQWIKDGKPFDPEERFKVLLQDDEDSLALVFTHVKPEDAGLYTCVASTTSGKISCSAELTVQGNVNLLAREPEAPAISASHKSVEANVGSSAMLETKLKGYPKPDIKWFKDSKEITMGDRYKVLYEDEETISLVVKTVAAQDDGEYKVVATNAAGSSEDTITLNIKAPPTFKKKLNDVSVTAGAELKLQIEVTANPKPDVQWFKDGKQITKSEHIKIVEENETYTLLIENCNLFDVGSYSVICKNNISQCTEFCKVDVEGAPIFTRNLIKKVDTEEGDSLSFLVKVHGNPMPNVKWYFKGQPVATDSRCKISQDMDTHTLTINSINRADAGEYTCELSNVHGTVSDRGTIYVKCSPEFSQGLGNLVAQEGDTNVGFNVKVKSCPKGKVRWYINSTEISSTSSNYQFKEEDDSYTLVVKEVTRESAGTYTCKVENSYGSNESSAQLTVLCKPLFKQELKNVTVNAGETLTLEIEIQGTPQPEIKWFKNGAEITNDMTHIKIKRDSQRIENYSLTVDLVKAEDSGEYEVRASNEMGSAISKSTVTVQTKSCFGFYDKTTSRTTKDDNSNTTIQTSHEKYRETNNTDNITISNSEPVNHVDESTNFNQGATDAVTDINKQRRPSKQSPFSKKFKIFVEDVFEEPRCVTITSADDEDDFIGGPEPLVSEPCTPRTPEKMRNRIEIIEVSESSQQVELEVDKSMKNTIHNIQESIPDANETKVLHGDSKMKPEKEMIIERNEINEPDLAHPKQDTKSNETTSVVYEKQSEEVKSDEVPRKSSIIGFEKQQLSLNSDEDNISVLNTEADLAKHSSFEDSEDPVEKLLKKSKEQRASLSQIIQKSQEAEEAKLQALHSYNITNGTNQCDLNTNTVGSILKKTEENKKNSENDRDMQYSDPNPTIQTDLSEGFFNGVDKITELTGKCQTKSTGQILQTSNEELDVNISTTKSHNRIINCNEEKFNKSNGIHIGKEENLEDIDENELNFTFKCANLNGTVEPLSNGLHNPSDSSESVTLTLKSRNSDAHGGVTEESFKYCEPKLKNTGSSKNRLVEEFDKLDIKIPSEILRNYSKDKLDELLKSGHEEDKIEKRDHTIKYMLDYQSGHELPPTGVNEGVLDTEDKLRERDDNSAIHFKIKENVPFEKHDDFLNKQPQNNIKESNYCDVFNHDNRENKGKPGTEELPIVTDKAEIDNEIDVGNQLPNVNSTVFTHNKSIAEEINQNAGHLHYMSESKDVSIQITDDQNYPVNAILNKLTIEEDKDIQLPFTGNDFLAVKSVESPSKDSYPWTNNQTNISDHCNDDREDNTIFIEKYDDTEALLENNIGIESNKEHLKQKPNRKVGLIHQESIKDDCDRKTSVSKDNCQESLIERKTDPQEQTPETHQGTHLDVLCSDSSLEAIPSITDSQMKNTEVFETWETSFQVTASGVPLPEATWTLNGKVLEPSQKRKMTVSGNTYRLEIINCQAEDDGEYLVTVKNLLGEDTAKAILSVKSAQNFRLPQIQKPLVDQKVPKNETVSMVLVLTADPIPEVDWKHDGKELDPDFILTSDSKLIHHGLKECTYTLTIPVSKHFDTGNYKFTATNKSGKVTSSARLDIILKPEFEMFKDVTCVPHVNTSLVAVIRSNPRATLTWRKDGNKVTENDRYTFSNDTVTEIYKLNVNNVLPEDGALFTLSAVNDIGEASADAHLCVHTEEPTFPKLLEDVAVRDYALLELKIRAEGIPKPDISWAKDGTDLVVSEELQLYTRCEGQVSSTITIPHFNEEFCGKYRARAQNLAGHADTQCIVRMVQLAPSFSKALDRAVNAEENDPVELHCKVEASPRAQFKWFKDGEELVPNDNVNFSFKPDGSVKLRIESAKPEDCGAYKLVAQNANGTDSAICAISVTPNSKKPMFLSEPNDVDLIEGEPMMLEAKVVGFPLPEIKWFKDGLPVRMSKSINFVNSPGGVIGLSIENVGVEHAGVYNLTVSNKLGEASTSAKVTVRLKDRKPEFHGHLVPATVVEGFPAKLTVKVAGTPLPELAWSLNGAPIDIDGEHFRIVDLPDGTVSLMIENSGPQDAGTYSVTATNPAGSITSTAKLDVTGQARSDIPEEPPEFAYEMRDAHADEGSQLQFSIPFRGNPVPQVTWTKNGVLVKPDHRITLTNDGNKLSLQINPCEMGDIGEYVCKLSSKLGQAETSAKANVRKIFHAPVFTQKLMDTEQVIGLDGKMSCRVTGNPRPTIAWHVNDRELIQDGPKYSLKRDGDTCTLYIKDCSPDDVAVYSCTAENRDGKDSCQANFKAVDKISSVDKGECPSFLKKIGDQEVINGITGRFTACIAGYPTPEVEWFRNDERLFPSDRIKMDQENNGLLRLTVTHIDPAIDIGKYKVRIFNDHGEDECEASFIYDIMGLGQRRPVGEQYKDFEEFKLTGSPLPLPDKPIISRMSDRRLTLSWKPSIPIGPREPVSYLVEMCEMPGGSWFIARSGLRSCSCEIRNLEPFKDYRFRVRVENKFGVSEPSPFSQTYRAKLLPDQPKFIPYLAPGIDFRPDTSPYFPKDFDIERPPHDGYAQAPRFLRQEHFTQYGVKGHNCNLFWFVYGYPKPKMSYFFNGEPVEMGGRYNSSYTRNGQATLFINRMHERDVGVYEAVASNEHGEARQRVHLDIAEYPEFIRRPEEITILARQGGRIEARVIGVPYPEIKWFKDWQPLAHSARIKIQRYDPDHCVLAITDAISKDSGLYSITASNIAGAVSCSVMVHIEEKEEFPFHMYGLGHNIKLKTKNLSDFYDLGDELGRGTQGITYHAVERSTGRNYAAKVMKGKGELKSLMHNELDIMNILKNYKIIKIHDGFETLDTIILVMELASGGELLDCLTKTPYTNENEIASYIRQLLVGLDYLHDQNIAHVGLTPGDLLISHSGGDSLKICDYGLARRIHPGQLKPEHYGMPEYISPEIIRGEGVSLATDMWSVGVITHLLLTGVSLFKGANDMETLTRVREGFWEFNDEYWKTLSLDARDFVTKLLVIDPLNRMDVKEALRHPWLRIADYAPSDSSSISTENLHNYYNSWKDWYSNASCRTWYRKRPLAGAFTHPSRMVYPPNYVATPSESPEREIKGRDTRPRPNLGDTIYSRQPIGYDVGAVSSESHYQCGPDTYLLQLRDVDFPVRLREYMKVAAHRHVIPKVTDEPSHLDWELPVIRERRRFTDIMDEEIDDERRSRINQYNLGDTYTVRRLKHELGTRLDTHVEAEALIEATRQGQAPFMREKPQSTAVLEGTPAEIICFAIGDPKPVIQWFKNDMMIGNSNRVTIEDDSKGRSILKFHPASNTDTGIYKVVARNRIGQTVARCRVVLASVPDAPDSPEVTDLSDTQVLLRWKQPKHDGNDPVVCYMVQSKVVEGGEWKTMSDRIDHEFFLVHGLKPVTGYIFRLAAKNKIGWSDTSVSCSTVRTNEEGCPKVQISKTMKHLQSLCETGQNITEISTKCPLDYCQEDNPMDWLVNVPTEKYNFISEIYRGRFSVVVKAIDKTNNHVVVCKLFEHSSVEEDKVNAEFQVLRTLKHERIANLIEAYLPPDTTYCALVLEKLQGADILTYLSNRHEYTEQNVASIISQVLDALQYLHWRGYCHLDLQPDNIVMASVRSVQVKLVDFGCAQRVTKLGNVVKTHGALEFSAPEVICQEPSYPQSDIWSVGVLSYLLLSGVSPFHGESVGETRQNINFVRYRFEHLYKEITQEATRFLMQIFKRTPNKRPSAEECQEHRWLCPNEYMIKKRERAVFLGNRLKGYSDTYHQQRDQEASSLEALTCLVSSQGPLLRSNSIAEELTTTSS